MPTRLRIITFDELPNWMKDNDLVITGYRAPTPSFWICAKTLFSLHNETLSIWSHLLASIYFFSLYASDLKYRHCRTLVNDDLFLKLYYLTATIAFICSAIYHLFCCYSHYVRDILVKVDYIGITIFITGSFMTWLYYAFHGETSQNCVYLYAICFGGLLVGILTQLDHFNARESRGHRAGIYVIFGLSLTIPAILLFQKSCKSRQTTKIISSVIYTTIIYMTGGFIYTTRLTERLWPGKVDIIGHSHQIFHIIVVIASIVHEKMIVFIATTNEEMIDTKKWLL